MWVRGTSEGCKNKFASSESYDTYCYEFVGPVAEYNGDTTPYSNVSGWELTRSHFTQTLDSATRTDCNAIASCGWATFAAQNGLSTFCNIDDDWYDSGDTTTDVIYLYTPQYCKRGYELILYTSVGSTCYPMSQNEVIYACSPCALGEYVRICLWCASNMRACVPAHSDRYHLCFFGGVYQDTIRSMKTIRKLPKRSARFARPDDMLLHWLQVDAQIAALAKSVLMSAGTRSNRIQHARIVPAVKLPLSNLM